MNVIRNIVDKKAVKYLNLLQTKGVLHEACSHALEGGKRIRSCIVLGMIQSLLCFSRQIKDFKFLKHHYLAAVAVEYLHNASLIIDDLPCMDNDLERRGMPTVHAKYGERVAQLAATSLTSLAIMCLAEAVEILDKKTGLFIIRYVTERMGASGASGGEMKEFESDIDPKDSATRVREIIHMKTSTFFEISMVIGWLFGKGDINLISEITKSAQCIGLAYQIVDDVEDIDQDRKAGSTVNYVIENGKEKASTDFEKSLSDVLIYLPTEARCEPINYVCANLRNRFTLGSFLDA